MSALYFHLSVCIFLVPWGDEGWLEFGNQIWSSSMANSYLEVTGRQFRLNLCFPPADDATAAAATSADVKGSVYDQDHHQGRPSSSSVSA